MPGAQLCHTAQLAALLLSLKLPLLQPAHTRSELPVPAVASYCPGTHVAHAAQSLALSALLKVPGAQAAQARSAVALPAASTRSPATQVLHALQLVAFSTLLYVPLAHALHARSVVASPSVTTWLPAAQVLRATHAVAGSLSWSQVLSPSSQAITAALPPAQYSPASHAVQTGGAVMLAGVVSTVPGGQEPTGTHMVWLGPDVYVPSAHWSHARSFAAVPATSTYSPATQVVQALQPTAFVVSL